MSEVPATTQALWATSSTTYTGVPTTRPGSTWSTAEARSAATVLTQFYTDFIRTQVADEDISMPGGGIDKGAPYWACDTRLCTTNCLNLPAICNANNRKRVIDNLFQWLGDDATTQAMTEAAIGENTTLVGEVLYNEPLDRVRSFAAKLTGAIPMNRMLLQIAGQPGRYMSWTVNALLSILSGWPGRNGASYDAEHPSYDTVSNAIAALREMTVRTTPNNIRQQIVDVVRKRFTDNAGRGGALDIRVSSDRPGAWTQQERNALYFEAAQLDAHITSLPEPPAPPEPIPNPWHPSPSQIPDPGVYPPSSGVFGRHTSIAVGLLAGLGTVSVAGLLLWRHQRRQHQPSLQAPFSRAVYTRRFRR